MDTGAGISYYDDMVLIATHFVISTLSGWLLLPAFEGKLLGRPILSSFSARQNDMGYRIFSALAFAIVSSLVFAKVLTDGDRSSLAVAVIMFFTYGVTATLIYLTATDIRTMQVPRLHLAVLTGVLLLMNLLLLIPNGLSSVYLLWEGNTFVPVQNIISGLLLASAVFLIIVLTKGKGMGRADIAIAAVLGLVNGYAGSVLGVYIAIFSALIYGLTVAARKGKIKNTRIPFIPFLVLGTVIGFLLPDDSLITILQFLRP